jgi:hypothetical protein
MGFQKLGDDLANNHYCAAYQDAPNGVTEITQG